MIRMPLALVGASLLAAACTMETTPPTAPTPVVTVTAPTPAGPAKVTVSDPKVISTDVAALAGTYNRSKEACAAAAAQGANMSNQSSYMAVLSPSAMNLNGKKCNITGSARDGSSLRFGLACNTTGGVMAEEAVVTRTAQGIQLRNGVNPVETLVNCAAK